MDFSNASLQKWNVSSLWLLISLLFSLLVLPLIEGLYLGRTLLLVGLTTTFFLGAIIEHSNLRMLTFVLLVVALPTTWATLFIKSKLLFVAHCILGSVFFWLVGGLIVYAVIKARKITIDTVLGAISAYLLFGLAWALSYWAIHSVSPDAFSISNENALANLEKTQKVAGASNYIYYSFVTMTTLGYGDITPTDRIARTLSWMQSVVGQFYVAVIIAWLVSALPRPGDSAI